MTCGTLAPPDMAPRLAEPGDGDLTLDIDGVTVTGVVRNGHEMWVSARGGFGRWVCVDGSEAEFEPGDPTAGVTTVDLMFGFPTATERLLVDVYDRLCRWRDLAVPLRICGARDRMGVMCVDASDWMPIPLEPLEESP